MKIWEFLPWGGLGYCRHFLWSLNEFDNDITNPIRHKLIFCDIIDHNFSCKILAIPRSQIVAPDMPSLAKNSTLISMKMETHQQAGPQKEFLRGIPQIGAKNFEVVPHSLGLMFFFGAGVLFQSATSKIPSRWTRPHQKLPASWNVRLKKEKSVVFNPFNDHIVFLYAWTKST